MSLKSNFTYANISLARFRTSTFNRDEMWDRRWPWNVKLDLKNRIACKRSYFRWNLEMSDGCLSLSKLNRIRWFHWSTCWCPPPFWQCPEPAGQCPAKNNLIALSLHQVPVYRLNSRSSFLDCNHGAICGEIWYEMRLLLCFIIGQYRLHSLYISIEKHTQFYDCRT
jgi:hypothetical protein